MELFKIEKKEKCSICNKYFITCYKLKDKNNICKSCIKKFGGFWTSNWNQMTKKEIIDSINEKKKDNIYANAELLKGIRSDKEIKKQVAIDSLNLKYEDILKKSFEIVDYERNNKIYSNAINCKDGIYNKYSEEYIKLAEKYLKLLPDLVNYDREYYKLTDLGTPNKCHKFLKQYILLLDKQKKYYEESNVVLFLIGLGICDDGTKDGLKGRADILISKIK